MVYILARPIWQGYHLMAQQVVLLHHVVTNKTSQTTFNIFQGFCVIFTFFFVIPAVLPWSLTERAGCQGSWTDFSEDRPSAYSGHVRDTRSVEECAGHNVTNTFNLVCSTSVISPTFLGAIQEK